MVAETRKDIFDQINNNNGLEIENKTVRMVQNESLINFNGKNEHDNWSFEFTIQNLNISYPAHGTINLFYTREKLTKDLDFEGFFIGLSFLGRSADIIIGLNDNKKGTLQDFIIFRDSFDPKRLRGVTNLTVKIISTNKNFKLELFNNKEIIYDNMKFIKTPDLYREPGYYFSLYADYQNVPLNQRFILSDFILSKRIEGDNYKISFKNPNYVSNNRMHDEINHKDEDVRHLISSMETTINLISNLLGNPIGISIAQLTKNINIHLTKLIKDQEDLQKLINKSGNPQSIIRNLRENFKTIETILNETTSQNQRLIDFHNIVERRIMEKVRNVNAFLILFSLGFIILKLLKYFIFRKTSEKIAKD